MKNLVSSQKRAPEVSIRVMSLVWEKSPYAEGTLLVHLALADWADDEGVCWPKRKQIAAKARLTEDGVKFCMRRLLADGEVLLEQESRGPGQPRKYRLHEKYTNGVSNLPQRGLVKRQKGVSNHTRNKEEPSLTVIKTNTKCAKHPNAGLTNWGTCWDCYQERYSESFGVEPPVGAAV